eukprot:XP_017446511.1 PREDICTED: fatty acid-binding protein 12 isoform X2 [Rattus norvegicus]
MPGIYHLAMQGQVRKFDLQAKETVSGEPTFDSKLLASRTVRKKCPFVLQGWLSLRGGGWSGSTCPAASKHVLENLSQMQSHRFWASKLQLLHYDTVWVLDDQWEDTEANQFILFSHRLNAVLTPHQGNFSLQQTDADHRRNS